LQGNSKDARSLGWKRFFVFTLVGAIGFAIEAAVIEAATRMFGISPVFARCFSFPVAVTVTWWLNRKYNFRTIGSRLSEGGRYLVAQVGGALANLAIFVVVLSAWPLAASWPLIGLGIGAVGGLGANFLLANFFVFRTPGELDE